MLLPTPLNTVSFPLYTQLRILDISMIHKKLHEDEIHVLLTIYHFFLSLESPDTTEANV